MREPPIPQTEPAALKRLQDENHEQTRLIAELRGALDLAARERFLSGLLCGTEPAGDQLAQFCPQISQLPYKAVAVFEIDMSYIPPVYAPDFVKDTVCAQLTGRCGFAALAEPFGAIAVTAWDTPGRIAELIHAADDVCIKCLKALGFKLTSGIGRGYAGASRIRDSFLEARHALSYKSVTGAGKAIYIEDVRADESAHAGHAGESLFSAVRFGSPEQIVMHLNDMRERASALNRWEYEAWVCGLLNQAYKIIERYALYDEREITDLLRRRVSAVDPASSGDWLGGWFAQLCRRMNACIKTGRESAARSLSAEAKRFIATHYHENLSVERLCEYLHVSRSYFSTVFRQETGETYVQYLTEARLNQAASLLQQTDDKTYMIATKVGYDDANYFSLIFKKRFGVSPTKYRKIARGL